MATLSPGCSVILRVRAPAGVAGGTAVVALDNALRVVDRRLADIRIVVSGVGDAHSAAPA